LSGSRGISEGTNSVPRPTPLNRVLSHLFGLLLIFLSNTLHSFFLSFFTSHSFSHGFRRSSSTEISCVHCSARSQCHRLSTKYPGGPPKHFHRTRQHVPDNSNAFRPCKSQECSTCVACKHSSLHLLRHYLTSAVPCLQCHLPTLPLQQTQHPLYNRAFHTLPPCNHYFEVPLDGM
jgi:hypothetical protein